MAHSLRRLAAQWPKKLKSRLGFLHFYWPALVVCAAIFAATFYVDQQGRHSFLEDSRAKVSERLATLKARLEGNLRANMKLLQAFAVLTETERSLEPERFTELGRHLLVGPSQLQAISLVGPRVGVLAYPAYSAAYPPGFYDADEEARARTAQESRNFLVTGPRKAPSGHQVFRIFYPVIIDAPRDAHSFYSTVIGTVDMNELFEASGLKDPDLPIDVLLFDRGSNGRPAAFFGNTDLLGGMTVQMDVAFGAQSWTLAAAPKTGWQANDTDLWQHRMVMIFLAMAIVMPVLRVASLLRERHQHITVLNDQRQELHRLSQRLHIALHASQIGVWELDTETELLNFDERMREFYDIDHSEAPLRLCDWFYAIHPDDRQAMRDALEDSLKGRGNFTVQFRVTSRTGETRHLRAFGTCYRDQLARHKVVGVHWNVTGDVMLQQALSQAKHAVEAQNRELENARRAMEHTSLHDPLTGLANRRYLDNHLATLEERCENSETALLHIDLDRFKEINDTLGHAAGDAMLKHVAAQIRALTAGQDFAARIGGDEFVVVFERGESDARDLGEALIAAINRPIECMGQECRIGASIGIAMVAGDETGSLAQTLINADIALYEAKRRGKNRVEFFNDHLKTATLATKQTADAILRSLEAQDFIAHYQPQFDARSLDIVGVEALARWKHPDLGLLTPSHFLDVAESLNVVALIDKAILEQTLAETRRWQAAGFDPLHVSVNISAQRLFDASLVQRLTDLDLPPGGLTFELLESISFDDKDEAAAHAIERIKALGIHVEIDDFGTGYSSILSLLKLSPRRLKIDRQLILPVPKSKPLQRLIGSIVDIGRSLGIDIVAEGVETMRHAEILRDLGCQTLQGYALARPMSGDDLFTLLAERRHAASALEIA
ncbi:putative bifunctional diguanylate cyclase/phosphodiesterase [Rhizobium paknamense]|uniref:Diguanylate cyclase (GGDEF)-like protein n=1 Tax=Rhizobium paknamense TaxID=1206817 RepID=A0ABU0I821_9HYPH|nr:EAL domain-containing protein [Rhizobium paknamense]MDQ0454381.1 diguanylate cyclase (GGDEF)-like protein [Rhizobium paknamense]